MPVGAGLARDGRAAVRLTDRIASIASKPAPTRSAQCLWEPGLPAMAAPRCASFQRRSLSALARLMASGKRGSKVAW
jgi:hypothetical protein